MEPSQSQTTDNTAKPKATSLFPLWKLKGTQPVVEMATVHLVHVWKRRVLRRMKGWIVRTLMVLKGVTEELMVCLVRAVKDAPKRREKCCYHCSSLDHFICDCPLVKASRMGLHINHKDGTATNKGAQVPSGTKVTKPT